MKLFKSSHTSPAPSSPAAPQQEHQSGRNTSSHSRGGRRRSSGASSVKSAGSANPDSTRRGSSSKSLLSKMRNKQQQSLRQQYVPADVLVARRRWSSLLECLRTERGREDVLAHYELEVGEDSMGRAAEETLLHAACRTGAPVEVVRALVGVVPEMAVVRDGEGRTALHCACAASALSSPPSSSSSSRSSRSARGPQDSQEASPMANKVVPYLLEVDSRATSGHAVATQDDEGRLPIHLACGAARDEDDAEDRFRHAVPSNECDDILAAANALSLRSGPPRSAAPGPPDAKVIELLLRTHPYSINVEDEDECTALEFAIVNGVATKTVRLMRKTSERVWKKEQKCAEERKLEEVRTSKNRVVMGGGGTTPAQVKRSATAA